jgi:predicted nucleotidyltransferase component of viral defense system
MIPQADIVAWHAGAPWPSDAQVEQDLVLSRALVEMFSEEVVRKNLAFRGGTALNKLVLKSPARYSEDIDLVQVNAAPIGPTLDAIRKRLDPWLGQPSRERNEGRVILRYRFRSELPPSTNLRLKIEINTREHFSVLGLGTHRFFVKSPWFSGDAILPTYRLEEMLGTKLRALYQRKKGRDLFDIAVSCDHFPKIDRQTVVKCFHRYMEHGNHHVSRAEYEANLTQKIQLPIFLDDLPPLLAPGSARTFDFDAAFSLVMNEFVSLLPGEPWSAPAKKKRKARGSGT